MICFKNNNETMRFNYFGVCFIQCSNITNFIKKFIISDNSTIEINSCTINKKDIVIINKITKRSELIELTKNSFLYKEIVSHLNDKDLINREVLFEIKNKINNNTESIDIIDINDGDLFKIISQLFSINSSDYIDKSFLKYLFDNAYDNLKKTFILVDCDFVSINELLKYSNNHNFIVVTSNIFNNINYLDEIENMIIYDDFSKKSIQIDDVNTIKNYIELKISREFNVCYIPEIKNSFPNQLNIISFLYKIL